MSRPFSRPACLALLFGLIGLASPAAEASNFGVNLNVRTQNIPQTTYVGGRTPHTGGVPYGGAPVPSNGGAYGGPGSRSHPHLYNSSTQFDGMGDSSAHTKLK